MNAQLIVIPLKLNILLIKPIMNMPRLRQPLQNTVFKRVLTLSRLCLNLFLSFIGTFFFHQCYFQEFARSYVPQAKPDSPPLDFISQMREDDPLKKLG